jgi:D-tyrosyl-tRNA(Tyr) deacylase
VKLVIQRVSRASVRVEGGVVASIGRGLLILVAIEKGDAPSLAAAAAEKIAGLRIFPGPGSVRLSRSITEAGGEILVVSQFTLAATLRKGRRPSFDDAAPADVAAPLCGTLAGALRSKGVSVGEGVFGARMEVELVNDGPVTFWMQSTTSGEFGP